MEAAKAAVTNTGGVCSPEEHGTVKNTVRTLNFRKANSLFSRNVSRMPGETASESREQSKAGRSLQTLSLGHKTLYPQI